VYTWSKQQDMSIHEQRIVLRILEACQAELKGVKLKDYAGTKRKFEHGLWDVDAQMHVSDVIFSGRDYNEIIAALDSLAGRFFTYEDDEEWWKCGFISNPKYKKRTGIITFRVSNDLWDVFTKFAKGYREFELNKALALPTGYSLRFYMLMSGQVYPLDISLENLKDRLGIPADKYKDKNGKDRIDHFEERVLKPAKAALDESCPYTFNYVKVRENPNNKRSKVTGFRFYPVYQPQFRDEELEGKELQAKVTARYQIDSHVYEYLRYSCGFTSEE
ncbi:replication initiation protein, partial [Bacteroides ovatus]